MRYGSKILLGIVIKVVIVYYATAQAGTNLLENGSFEQGLSPWTVEGGAYALDIQVARHGQQSLRLQNAMARYSVVTGLTAGATYRLTAWFRIDPASSGYDWGGIYMSLLTYDWGVVRETAFTPYNRPLGVWFKESVLFSAPADGRLRIHLGFFGGSGWQLPFWLDDVRLTLAGLNQPPEIAAIHVLPANSGNAPWPLTVVVHAEDTDGALEAKWVDFGDGATAVGLTDTFRHTYGVPGRYRLRVWVRDDEGVSAVWSDTVQIIAPNHAPDIRITAPTSAPEWTTATSTIVLSGTRSGWSGMLFWINERTAQSGWVNAGTNATWTLPPITLEHGENIIAVQGITSQGLAVIARLKVHRHDPTYTAPRLLQLACDPPQTQAWSLWSCRFRLETRGTDAFLPFGHLPGDSSGITAEALFVSKGDTLVMPCFYTLDHEPAGDDLRTVGEWHWALRMSFPREGLWSGWLRIEDRSGKTIASLPTVTVAGHAGKGYIRPSATDNRYFEHADGSPFLPMGYNVGTDHPLPELDEHLARWSANGITYGRIWISPTAPFSDAWSSWATHHPMQHNGYLPASVLTPERRYGRGDVSWKIAWPPIENVQTPSIFRGFWSSVTLEPGRTYRITARVRVEGVSGSGGLVLKTGGWLGTDDIQPNVGTRLSPYVLRGYSDWVYLTADWTAQEERLPFLYLTLENVSAGAAWIDQFTLQPIYPDGRLGPNVLDTWNANAHRYADPIECRKVDYLIREAARRGIYYQAVILEKNDALLNFFDRYGAINPAKGEFEPLPGTYLDRLYEAYWRHLVARWGWAPSVAAWELVNEGAPGSYFDLLERMAAFFRKHGPFPRMVSTSFWSEWVPEYWQASSAGYADVHAYVITTGFLDGFELEGQWYDRQALQRDAAALIEAYGRRLSTDPLRNKPVIIGETDLDQPGDQAPDPLLALDTAGVWLHDWVWGHLFAGGVCGLIWNSDNLEALQLHRHYRPFAAFVANVPFNTGRYELAKATADQPALRVRALRNAKRDDVLLWVRHREHFWHRVVTQGLPTPTEGTVRIEGLQPGKYRVSLWEPWAFDTLPQQTWTTLVGADSALLVLVQPMQRDKAWRIQQIGTSSVRHEATSELLRVWPIPARSQLFVAWEGPELPATTPVLLTNAAGQVVHQARWSDFPLHVEGLPSGIYFLHVLGPDQAHVKRVGIGL
ncbi:MAG: PKD domain-containing protein [Saprospiraceae bacterium]|nr:PKD domain-containing protein [Saprospiraceae bacterium]MDW8483665.1 PKD domain-containing protein [Saprospiraceae bacterium]